MTKGRSDKRMTGMRPAKLCLPKQVIMENILYSKPNKLVVLCMFDPSPAESPVIQPMSSGLDARRWSTRRANNKEYLFDSA